MRALIDTCVVIDALQSREPFCREAQALFICAANGQFDGFITAKSSTDIYYLTHRCTHSDSDSREVLERLFILFELLDTAGVDCRRALVSAMADYEDAVMAESALRAGMDCIVTRDAKDYAKSPVPVCRPAELLRRVSG